MGSPETVRAKGGETLHAGLSRKERLEELLLRAEIEESGERKSMDGRQRGPPPGSSGWLILEVADDACPDTRVKHAPLDQTE